VKKNFLKYYNFFFNYRTIVAILLLFSFSTVSFAVDLHSCVCKIKNISEAEAKVEEKSCCKKETNSGGTEKKMKSCATEKETKSCGTDQPSADRKTKSCGTDQPSADRKTNGKQCEKREKKDCNNCGKCSFDKNEFETPVSTASGNSQYSETVIFNTSNESIYDHTSRHQVPANVSPPGGTSKKYITVLRI
jgi:hypothetical protein